MTSAMLFDEAYDRQAEEWFEASVECAACTERYIEPEEDEPGCPYCGCQQVIVYEPGPHDGGPAWLLELFTTTKGA